MDIRLSRIKISGMRAAQELLSLDLVNPRGKAVNTVVIAGPNGSGKTTCLEAILLGLGREQLIAEAGSGTFPLWRRCIPEGGRIEIELEVQSAPGTVLGPMTPCHIRLDRDSQHMKASAITTESGVERETHLETHLVLSALQGLQPRYFSSWRASELIGSVSVNTGESTGKFTEISRLAALKRRFINERAGHAFSKDSVYRDQIWLDRLNEIWRFWHANDGTFIKADLDPDAPERAYDLFICRTSEFGDEHRFRIDQASSGELEMFSMFGTLITEDFDGLLLIDEPELHLHASWQSLLLPSLRKILPNCQIVLATHSDAIWDHVFSYERILLLPKGDPREKRYHAPPPENETKE